MASRKLKKVKHNFSRTISTNYRGERISRVGGEYFYPVSMGGGIHHGGELLDYFMIPEVNAIYNKRASAHANIKIKVCDKETLEPVDNDLSRLLKNPNWYQSIEEFIVNSNLYHDIFGNEYSYCLYPEGFSTERTKALYTLMPSMVSPKISNMEGLFFQQSESPDVTYEVKTQGQKTILSADEIIHLADNQIYQDSKGGKKFECKSKLKSLKTPLDNMIAAYESRGVLIRNRGALGILTNDTKDVAGVIDIDEDEKIDIQNEYRSNYGIGSDQWNIIITNASLKWQQMALDVDKLKLFEEIKEDYIKIAVSYNYPPELLPSSGSPNLFGDNKAQSEKQWYLDSIIPEAAARINNLNDKFNTENESYQIIGTFDHLPIFKKDQKEQATRITLLTNALSRQLADGVITTEEYKQILLDNGQNFDIDDN